MNYQQIVDEARELVADIERVEPKQWRLAELCYLAVEEQAHKPGEFANAIGKSPGHVHRLRITWKRYGEPAARVGLHEAIGAEATFNDAFQLAVGTPEYVEAMIEVAREKGVQPGTVQRQFRPEVHAVREALTDAPADPEVRKQIAREVLQTPADAREVLSDIRTGAATTRAQRELDEQTRANSRERVRQHAPAALNLKGFIAARREWASAATALQHGISELEGVDLSTVERETLDGQLALVERWLTVARQRLTGQSFDVELAALMNQEN